MKFNITLKTITNEIRNYLALGLMVIGHILFIPVLICNAIANWLKVE